MAKQQDAISNYDKLQHNKSQALSFANGISAQSSPEENTINTSVTVKTQDVKNLVANGDYTQAIQTLDEIKDNRLGIVWHESENLGHGTKALVRDARGVTTDPTILRQDAGEKYGMQILNEIRGGLLLLENAEGLDETQKETAKAQLKYIAETAMKNLENLNSKTIRKYNTQILYSLKEAGIPNTERELNFAKEMANFQDDHKHIVTLTTSKDKDGVPHTVMEADIMLNGLTPKQQEEYQTIANSEKGSKTTDITWFDTMEPYKQELVRNCASNILSGNKVIPTQLISDLPGIKNAYQKVTAIAEPNNTTPKTLSESLHCGAPASKIKALKQKDEKATKKNEEAIKKEKQAITNENIAQLQTFVEPGKRVNLNILNSRTPGDIRGENFIFDQVEEAARQSRNVSSTASPINKWRKILEGGRHTDAYKQNLGLIADGLGSVDNTTHIRDYLKNGTSRFDNFLNIITFGKYKTVEMKAIKEFKELEKSPLKEDIKTALITRQLIDTHTLLADSQNVNLEVSANMQRLNDSVLREGGALHDMLNADQQKQYGENVDFCKSGKDRTGLLQFEKTHNAVNHHLGVDPNSAIAQTNLLSLAAGGHTQEMAGIQGGTVGCHSIKSNPEFALNKSHDTIKGILDQKSSHFNSSIKAEKEQKETIKAFEKDFDESRQSSVLAKLASETHISNGEIHIESSPLVSGQKLESWKERMEEHKSRDQEPGI